MGKDQELLEAARSGNTAVVEKILGQRAKRSGPLASLRRGPGANVQDSSGYSALHHAALNGHREIVKLLLEHDASTNIVDCKGSTPLHLASWKGDVDIVRQLLTGPCITNVNLTTKDSETALHSAAQYGHSAVVSYLLDYQCDPTIRNTRGETALDLAAQYGRLEAVELLLHRNRELIQPMRRAVPGIVFPHTPLHLASRNGHRPVVEALLGAGFDVNVRTPAGTALHEAAICGKVEVCRTLLEHGVDLSVRDAHGNTVLDLLSQFPAHATSEIMSIIRRFARPSLADSDQEESLSQPFPVNQADSTLGSPYENVRPVSRGFQRHSPPPGLNSSPPTNRWDYYRQCRSVDMEDRRVSGVSAMSIFRSRRIYRSMPIRLKQKNRKSLAQIESLHKSSILDSVTFSFSAQCSMGQTKPKPKKRTLLPLKGKNSSQNTERGSDNSVYQTPPAPKSFMDSSAHSEDLSYSIYSGNDGDQISLSSTASSHSRDRRTDGGTPLYLPMGRTSHSPSSNSKVSPTPPKKPPRRNLSVSPTHLQPMSSSEGGSNNPYEYIYLARSGARSQSDLDELDPKPPTPKLRHGRSVDTYVEMNTVFSMGPEEIDGDINSEDDGLHFKREPRKPKTRMRHGKSLETYVEMSKGFSMEAEEIDQNMQDQPSDKFRKLRQNKSLESYVDMKLSIPQHEEKEPEEPIEPVAITAVYENMVVKAQNPRRKLRRNQDDYEPFDFHDSVIVTSSSAPETYVSNAFLSIKSGSKDDLQSSASDGTQFKPKKVVKLIHIPLSPTHYNQPPTPDHPPPSAIQAERSICDRIRPLSQEYKRRSRDMETETEDEYLLFGVEESSCTSGTEESSSVSLSDKSHSNNSSDNQVEEFVGDQPFAGLFKGSTKVLETLPGQKPIPAERPKTLTRKLKNVYENANGTNMAKNEEEMKNPKPQIQTSKTIPTNQNQTTNNQNTSTSEKDKSLSILSPFDEQEEWAKIQEIMASFGTGLVRESVFVSELEKEFQARLMTLNRGHKKDQNKLTTIESWLGSLNMSEYEGLFVNNGFDRIEFLNGTLEESDLKQIGITNPTEITLILESIKSFPNKFQNNNNLSDLPDSVDGWLRSIGLECHSETFSKHLYLDMERIKRIWDVELSAVLEIEKLGHRKRILASVSGGESITPGPKLEDINADLNMLNTNIQQLKDEMKSTNSNTNTNTNTGTLRHRHKKSRPAPPPPINVPKPTNNGQSGATQQDIEIRDPCELLVEAGTPLKAQWKHKPITLITSSINYLVNYLGSALIKELRGTESTVKAIQKLRKTSTNVKPTPEIILSISYRGVKFLNTITKTLVCEHEIRNIHCACQDREDLTHFAYITKDHSTNSHYCHVFSTQSTDQTTEMILTLGQAFEVAYQMALRDQIKAKKAKNTITNPIRSPGSVSSKSKDIGKESPPSSRARSHSASEIKINGNHQLKITPLSFSTEPFGVEKPSQNKSSERNEDAKG